MDYENKSLLEKVEVENKPKKFTPLKVIWLVVFAITTFWIIWGFVDLMSFRGKTDWGFAFALYLTISVGVLGTAGYLLSVILGAVGVFISLKAFRNDKATKKTLICFVVMTLLPIVVEGLVFVVCKLMA